MNISPNTHMYLLQLITAYVLHVLSLYICGIAVQALWSIHYSLAPDFLKLCLHGYHLQMEPMFSSSNITQRRQNEFMQTG